MTTRDIKILCAISVLAAMANCTSGSDEPIKTDSGGSSLSALLYREVGGVCKRSTAILGLSGEAAGALQADAPTKLAELMTSFGNDGCGSAIVVSTTGAHAAISSPRGYWIFDFEQDELRPVTDVSDVLTFASPEWVLSIAKTTGFHTLISVADPDVRIDLKEKVVDVSATSDLVFMIDSNRQLKQGRLERQLKAVADVSVLVTDKDLIGISALFDGQVLALGFKNAFVEFRRTSEPNRSVTRVTGILKLNKFSARDAIATVRKSGDVYWVRVDRDGALANETSFRGYRPLGALIDGRFLGMKSDVSVEYAIISTDSRRNLEPVNVPMGMGISLIRDRRQSPSSKAGPSTSTPSQPTSPR